MPTYAGWRRSITSDTGVVVPSAQIEVFNAGLLTKPTIYADEEGAVTLTNPFDADANGFAEFYVAGGFYRIEAGAEGADGIWDWVAIGTAQGLDAGDVVAPGDLATVATTGDHVDLLNKGTNTHAQIDSHIADAQIHKPLDDATTSVNVVWSGSKISTELALKVEDWGDIGGTLSNQTDLQTVLNLKANTADLADVATSGDHTDLLNIGTNTHAQIDTHIANEAAGVHGSTVAATASKLVHRDASGRAQIADPSVAADIANKSYVDSVVGSGMDVKNSLEIDGGQAQLLNDESTPDQYSAYGKVTSVGWNKTHDMIFSSQEAFKLDANVTVDSSLDDTILFTSTAASTFGAGNAGIELGIYSTDYISTDSGFGGAVTVTAFIQKTGAGTVNIRAVKTGTAQIGGIAPVLALSGEGIFPITFNAFIVGQAGGINLEVEHSSGSNTITAYSHINVVRTAGSLLS